MNTVAGSIALLATAGLFGGMVFFSAVLAPLVFTRLQGDTAAGFIRAVFPWYYLFVLLLSATGALAFAWSDALTALVLAGVAAATAFARQVLMPRINRARDASLAGAAEAHARFARLHRLSVAINAVQIAAVALVLVRTAAAIGDGPP
jgi:hypothetical protein